MKYIVTGGAGFIGSHLVDTLIGLGHNVVVLDNLLSGFKQNVNPAATFYTCDIRRLDAIVEYFKDIDGVFHLAAIARTPWCVDDPVLAYETNVMGTLNFLEGVRKSEITAAVVITTSEAEINFFNASC